MPDTHVTIEREKNNYRKYGCGTVMANDFEHELPDECPECGESVVHNMVVDLNND